MNYGVSDEEAVLQVLRTETEAWLKRDFDSLEKHWVKSPLTRRMQHYASSGVLVDEGWDVIAKRLKDIMHRFPEKREFAEFVRWDKVSVTIIDNMAWVTYDEVKSDDGDDHKHELKILQRIKGAWKISCVVSMESAVNHKNCPLIEVDAGARVVWMNRLAKERISSHEGLAVSAGRLFPKQHKYAAELLKAVRAALKELQGQTRLTSSLKKAWPVRLGNDEAGQPMHCWVHLEDGKALVSFDDSKSIIDRIEQAQEIYRLSTSQVRLIKLIVDGHALASAAKVLGVSSNTLRTQLQRIFDKTGVRSQSALLRVILSISAPNN